MIDQINYTKARFIYLSRFYNLRGYNTALPPKHPYTPCQERSWQVVNGNWLLKNKHGTHIAMVDTQGNVSIPQWILEDIS